MILVLVGLVAGVAAVIQRITGLAFILVLIGPAVLVYGPIDGVTLAVLLAVIASLCAVPSSWRSVDWRRTRWLLVVGLAAAPFGALMPRVLPESALLFVIAGMAIVALLAPIFSGVVAVSLRGRRGMILAGATAGFMHASSGLSGPPLAMYAVGDKWDQRSFAASAQVILLGYGIVSLTLRGMPATPPWDLALLSACTVIGIIGGSFLVRVVPERLARTAMLWCAWAGALVVLVRAFFALLG